MNRYIPMEILSQAVLIFSFWDNPPTDFILKMKKYLMDRKSLIDPDVYNKLKEFYADYGNLKI